MKEKKIKIIVTDDQELMRDALISLLEEDKCIDIIGKAENGKGLLDLLKKTKPDIVLLDIEMPVMNGRETLDIIKKKFPEIKVIMLSMYNETALVSDFITRGANAFLSKGGDSNTMFNAIKTVHTEGCYYDNGISKALLKSLLHEKAINPLFDELALSKREIEVLKELCGGKTNKEIGKTLNISSSTVDFHRMNIYKKTKSNDITALVKYAIKHAIISLD